MNQSNLIKFGPFTIQNPNTSGQGVCDITQIKKHPLANILLGNGFNYSHSVVIGAGAGHLPQICHCFNYPSYFISTGKERFISVFNGADGKEIARFDSGILGGVSKIYTSNHISALQIKLESHLEYLDGRIRVAIRKVRDKLNETPIERECCFLIIPGRVRKEGFSPSIGACGE